MSKAKTLFVASSLLATVLGGCSLIKVNGKSLGGSSMPGGSSSSGSIRNSDGSTSPNTPSTNPADSPEAIAAVQAADEMKAGLPSYCKLRSMFGAHVQDLTAWQAEVSKPKRTRDGLTNVAVAYGKALCTTEGEAGQQHPKIETQRRAWMKANYLDDRDFRAMVGYPMDTGADGLAEEDVKDGPIKQQNEAVSGHFSYEKVDGFGAAMSQLTRAAAVQKSWDLETPPYAPAAINNQNLAAMILLSREPIDIGAGFKEIDSTSGLSDAARLRLRRMVVQASQAVTAVRATLAADAKTDPGIAKLIAIADETFKEWAKPSAEVVDLRNLVATLEAALQSNRRSAFQGCEDKTLAAWSAAVAATKFPEFTSDAHRDIYLNPVTANPRGSLAYSALTMCRYKSNPQALSSNAYQYPSVMRGPRTSTIARWMQNGSSIVFDNQNLNLKDVLSKSDFRPSGFEDGKQFSGVIASIEKTDTGSIVSFKLVKEPRITCSRWEKTNRIERIDSSGRIEYEQQCMARSKVMMETSPEPLAFDETMVRNLKPGMFLVATPLVPIVATSSASSNVPVYILGAAVK